MKEVYPLIRQEGRSPKLIPCGFLCQVIYLVLSDETPLNWARLPPLTCTGVCIPCTHAQRVAPSVLPPEQTNFALSVPSVLQNSPPDYFAKRKTDARTLYALNTSVSSSDLDGHIQLWQITGNL